MSRPVEELPSVSIVTPSYNMASFLRETIESVLSQGYPKLDYVVMDGGSQDGTVALLEGYRDRLRYLSAPDKGVVDALNRGFGMTQGSIAGWLNADDTYLPGAIRTAVDYLAAHPEIDVVYGQAHWIDEGGRVLRPYPARPYDPELLARECFLCQPACFFRRATLEEVGRLDSRLHFAFDYDLWIRLSRNHRFAMIPEYLATSRMHGSNKTLGQRDKAIRESMLVLKRHYGYVPFEWVHTYSTYLLDKRDQFFEEMKPSLMKYLLSLPLGTWYNAGKPLRFWREWAGVMSVAGAVRRWNAALAGIRRSRAK